MCSITICTLIFTLQHYIVLSLISYTVARLQLAVEPSILVHLSSSFFPVRIDTASLTCVSPAVIGIFVQLDLDFTELPQPQFSPIPSRVENSMKANGGNGYTAQSTQKLFSEEDKPLSQFPLASDNSTVRVLRKCRYRSIHTHNSLPERKRQEDRE